jgi:putative acetyltransferase
VEIREEREGDWEGIRRVHRSAFGGDVEVRLVDLLRARGKAVVSLVAVNGIDVVGHILFSPVTIDRGGDARSLGLAPVAVLPPFQRSGIGSKLIREGLTRCAGAGYDLVVIVGEPSYYARFGFQAAKPCGLDNEYGANEEFMVLELQKDSLQGTKGLVKYAPEFAEVNG